MEYVIHFFVAIILSFLSSIGGGGGGLIMTPYLLLWGIPPVTAIGTGKIGAFGLAATSTREFLKAKMVDLELAKRLAAILVFTSFLGATLAVEVDDETLTLAVSIVTLVISLTMLVLLLKGIGLKPRPAKHEHKIIGYVAYSINTTIQSGIGAGLGMLNSVILIGAFGLTALQAFAVKRMVNIIGVSVSAAVFIANGTINWVLAGVLLVSYSIGAYIGTKVAIKKGNRFIMTIQVILGLTMATVLLLR